LSAQLPPISCPQGMEICSESFPFSSKNQPFASFAPWRYKNVLMRKTVLVIVTICLACLSSGGIPSYAQKVSIDKLGPALVAILLEYEQKGAGPATEMAVNFGLMLRTVNGEPLLPIILEPLTPKSAGSIDRGFIQGLGLLVDATSHSFMRVLVPFPRITDLSSLPGVRQARLPLAKIPLDAGFGPTVSEAVQLTGAESLQLAGFIGQGVKVAVVDLGFMGLSNAIAAEELPADLHRVKGNQEGANIESTTVHGTGVAEHVMDMAPGAVLYCILIEDEVDFENSADFIRDNGIKVANHSVAWVNGSYYDDTGPITSIVNRSRDMDGVVWSVAAGNAARRHWRGTWQDPEGNDLLNFSGSDEAMQLTTSSTTAYVFLNWNQYGDSVTDLDLYIRNKTGGIIASSEGTQTGSQDPAEAVAFTYNSALAPYSVQVKRQSGPTEGLDITLFSFYNDFEYAVGSSSLMEPADAHGAFSVGAIYQGDWNDMAPPIESYSSRGPTTDGRLKPDITATDGTSSWTYGASYGTSFSAPTFAGATALMYQTDSLFSPVGAAQILDALAVDVGDPGSDNVFGAGKLRVALVCRGDLDGDHTVGERDVELFAPDFGSADCAGQCYGDLDADGDVDGSDLAVLISQFGRIGCEPLPQP
jgi:hypothetical protein